MVNPRPSVKEELTRLKEYCESSQDATGFCLTSDRSFFEESISSATFVAGPYFAEMEFTMSSAVSPSVEDMVNSISAKYGPATNVALEIDSSKNDRSDVRQKHHVFCGEPFRGGLVVSHRNLVELAVVEGAKNPLDSIRLERSP